MPCILCKEVPHNEPYRKDHIIVDDGTKHGSRSKEPRNFCPTCHEKGDYSSLACAVIAEAVEDYCYPKLTNKGRRQEVIANQMSAKGFLFSDNIIMWAQLAEVDIEDIRNHVNNIAKGRKNVH